MRTQAYIALQSLGRHGNDQGFGLVTDVSRTGIGLRTGQAPIRGQKVALRLSIDDEIRSLPASVIRVQPRKTSKDHYDVGLDWSECSEDEIDFLHRYLLAAMPTS